jgi:hypothetical protein
MAETSTDKVKICFEITKGGKSDTIACKYCKQSFKGSGVNKMFTHLGDVTWNGQRAQQKSGHNSAV